ncbi:MAG: chorismate mutase [Candidatus Rifleibacteriota bacterium]
MSSAKLEELRKIIDDVDDRLIELLNERIGLVKDVLAAKNEAEIARALDSAREQQILDRLQKQNNGPIKPEEIRKIFFQIFSVCRKRQQQRKICVFGEENGWVEDAALARFTQKEQIRNAETIDDFLSEIGNGNLGFACITPQFQLDRRAILENLLSGKISVVEEFDYQPEFSLVSNRTHDLSEVSELCVTNELLQLLRDFFVSMSFDAKINICRSDSEALENLQSIKPIAAILPSRLIENIEDDFIVIENNLKSELLSPVKFMTFAAESVKVKGQNFKATVLCAVNGENEKLWEILAVLNAFNLKLFDIQTVNFMDKPWKKVIAIEFSAPENQEIFEHIVNELQKKTILVRVCGVYPEING